MAAAPSPQFTSASEALAAASKAFATVRDLLREIEDPDEIADLLEGAFLSGGPAHQLGYLVQDVGIAVDLAGLTDNNLPAALFNGSTQLWLANLRVGRLGAEVHGAATTQWQRSLAAQSRSPVVQAHNGGPVAQGAPHQAPAPGGEHLRR